MSKASKGYALTLLLTGLLLSSCSSLQKQTEPDLPLIANQQIQQWQFKGKLGLRDGKQAHSAYVNWRQCDDRLDIRLSGPLGQGAAHLYGDSQGISLQTSDQQIFHASSPEQLLQQQLGWSLPISQLIYWVRGIPSPGHKVKYEHSTEALTTNFEQNQWQLSYPKFTAVDNHRLPAKAIAAQPPLKVTLIIKEWELHPNCDVEI